MCVCANVCVCVCVCRETNIPLCKTAHMNTEPNSMSMKYFIGKDEKQVKTRKGLILYFINNVLFTFSSN
jgi:hypothetical protein